MGSSSSWSIPTFGPAMGTSSSWPTATSEPTMFSSFAPTTGAPVVGWTPPMPHPAPTLFGSVSGKGSRIAAYAATIDDDCFNLYAQPSYLQSISAMPVYKHKSHEELRLEDYQAGDKGSSTSSPGSTSPSHPRCRRQCRLHRQRRQARPPRVVHAVTDNVAFTDNVARLDLSKSSTPSPTTLPSLTSSPGSTSPSHPRLRGYSLWQPPVKPVTPFVGTAVEQSAELQTSTQGLNCTNPCWLPSVGPQSSLFSDPTEQIRKLSLLSNTTEPIHNPYMGLQKNAFKFNSSPSSLPAPFFAPGGILSRTVAHTASADTSSTESHMFSQNSTQSGGGLLSASLAHSAPALSPKGQSTTINIDRQSKTIELLLPTDITQVKISFSSRNDVTGSLASQVHPNAKASATPVSFSIYPGENQELMIQSMEHHAASQTGKPCSSTGGFRFRPNDESGPSGEQKGNNTDAHLTRRSPLATPDCKVISETYTVLPRLYKADYYTVPSLAELAAREIDEPGHCSRVKGFVVGRHGYGSLKFDGETDVRKLDITSIVEFKEREVVVYRDVSKTPAVGQELNKPAEITLLDVKCVHPNTGLHLTEGEAVDKYSEVLVQWTKDHGAEFVSFDAAKGEWKFKVKHFSQ